MEIKENHFESSLLRRVLWSLTAGRARNHPASRLSKEEKPFRAMEDGAAGSDFRRCGKEPRMVRPY